MKVAIIGAGKLGLRVAEALLGGDHSVTIIDKDEKVIDKLSSHMDILAVCANGKVTDTLIELGIGSCDCVLTSMDRDEKNMVVAAFAKKLGCKKAIARIRDPEHIKQMDFIRETMNIDYLVNPEQAIATEIYKYLVEKYTLGNGIFTSGKVSLLEFPVAKMPKLKNLPLTEFRNILPGMLAVAISRNGKVIVPHGDTVIQEKDQIYVIGEREPILALSKKVHEKGKYTDLQKVMIIGGGKTGFYLASRLSEFGISVKVIEQSRERCHYLASNLDDVMILHGDATDVSLLEEENLDNMDAFVTTTGFDEENLLLALLAKKHGVADAIAKVSRESYASLTSSMGIDMALNPLDISSSNILRFIQGSKRVISSHLIQGQAEIMEIVARNHLYIMDTPLKDLHLPEDVLIVAIHRGSQVIIPNGDTKILEGDRVIILCLLSEIPVLESLLRPKAGVQQLLK